MEKRKESVFWGKAAERGRCRVSNLPDSSSRRRLLIVCLCIVALGFGMVVYNLYKVQITQGDFYQQRAIAQQLRTTPITANRGTIYDRNGNTLGSPPPYGRCCFPPTISTTPRRRSWPTA